MMKFCLSMMIIFNGITAILSEKSLELNTHLNHADTDFKNHNRIKRYEDNSVTLTGDAGDPLQLDNPETALNILRTVVGFESKFFYTKFHITKDLNYSTWEEFLSEYNYAELNDEIHIQFHRKDGKGNKFDLQVLPQRINLKEKIHFWHRNIEESYDTVTHFVGAKSPTSWRFLESRNFQASPFFDYRQVIFSESIWVGLSRIHAEIWLSMNGFIKDNELILQLIYMTQFSMMFTSAGATLQMHPPKEIVLK